MVVSQNILPETQSKSLQKHPELGFSCVPSVFSQAFHGLQIPPGWQYISVPSQFEAPHIQPLPVFTVVPSVSGQNVPLAHLFSSSKQYILSPSQFVVPHMHPAPRFLRMPSVISQNVPFAHLFSSSKQYMLSPSQFEEPHMHPSPVLMVFPSVSAQNDPFAHLLSSAIQKL